MAGSAGVLYLDVLESVFAFGTLQHLAALIAVCRSWQASVLQMRSIVARYSHVAVTAVAASLHTQQLSQSRVRRHHLSVAAYVDTSYVVTDRQFNALTQRLPHLLSLDIRVHCFGAARFSFPRACRRCLSTHGMNVRCQ